MWQAWLNGLLGVWLALAPFAGMGIPSARLNNILAVDYTEPTPAPEIQMPQGVTQSSAQTGASSEGAPPAEGGPPPDIDINRLTEQVYQRLRRRLQIEAERLGWSGRR